LLSGQEVIPEVKINQIDTTGKIISDTIRKVPNSGLDTVVTYSASDTIVFRVRAKKMRLRGQADVLYSRQNLKAEIIEMDFNKNLMHAEGVEDTTGNLYGYPQFSDNGEAFFGKIINYNFKTQKGAIVFGETEVDEGFYFAEKIKKKSANELFLKNGRFTTCDAPHPHYYFGSPTMEVIVNDRVFVDPIIFYVEDMPVFAVPFGMFFTLQNGRQSGLIIPSFFFSKNRGVTFENFGVYLALSDYYDTRFTVDFYSKGGFNLKNYTQWKYQDIFVGNMALEFGRTRFNSEEEYVRNWKFMLNHHHSFSPQEQIVANLNFSSQDYNRNTKWNQRERQVQSITSNASYSKSFDNGASFSAGYSRTQNIITNSYSQTPGISYTLPQYSLFKSFVASDSWLRDITFSYTGNVTYQDRRDITVIETVDTTYSNTSNTWSSKIQHSPRLSITLPKLSYFTFTPYINFSLNNYFRKGKKYFDMQDSTEKTNYEYGFYSEYSYNTGISMSTRIYGMAKPKIFGVNAIRHTLQPNFSFSFRPDQSNPDLGFYDSYYNPVTKMNVQYSNYQADGGGIASRQLSSSLNYSFVNNISVKIAQSDTVEDKTVDLLSFNINGNYDFAKDFRRLSDVSVSFHSTTLPGMNFSGNTLFTLYDEVWDVDNNNNPVIIPTNDLLISVNKGLARMTALRLSLSTGFSSEGIFTSLPVEEATESDTIGLGERFARRVNAKDQGFDFFGDQRPGYSKFTLPWSLSFNFNYSYNRPTIANKTQSLTVGTNFTFKITPTWYFDGSVQFDLLNREIVSPVINIRKDLHCWELFVTWYPTGYSQGFYLRFNIKSSLLKDLKWEQRSSDFW
jgi:hypothetical protein